MKIEGFITVKKEAAKIIAQNPEKFLGKDCAVLEFDKFGGALILCPENNELAMVDSEDVFTSFKCVMLNGVVIPAELNMLERVNYYESCIKRKGGYNNILANMVIKASLIKGKFYDSFLWQKQ